MVDRDNGKNKSDHRNTTNLSQSISHLHLDYGRSLQSEILRDDAFYALNEIFRFATASENQFLNLMESNIKSASTVQPDANISELQLAKALLEEHHQGIRQNLETVRLRGGLKWPKASESSLQDKAERAATRLQLDIEYLLERSRVLADQCKDGIAVLTNAESYRQSQRQIQQAEGIAKLTLLAFFFVPLSFTTSFFGMHFNELDKPLDIWVWFVVSVPVSLISFMVLMVDVIGAFQSCWRFTSRVLSRLIASAVKSFTQ